MPKYLTYKKDKLAYIKMGCIFLYLTFLPHSFNTVLGQESLNSKLYALDKSSGQNEQYVDVLNKLSQEYRFVKADSVYNLAFKALSISEKIGYKLGECEALDNIGGFYSDQGQNQKAISYYKNALALSDSIQDEKIKIGIINDLANEFSYSGNYEKALENFLIGLDLANETNNKLMQSILNENIASLYTSQKEYDQALEFYNEVKKINEEIGDEIVIAETLSNLSEVYADVGNFDHAMFNVNKSIATFEKEGIYDWLAFAYSVKGEIYLKQKKYKWALYWYDQSNLLHHDLEDDRSRIDLLNGMASAFLGLGEDSRSNDYALEAFEVSTNLKSLVGIRDCAKTLYQINKNNRA